MYYPIHVWPYPTALYTQVDTAGDSQAITFSIMLLCEPDVEFQFSHHFESSNCFLKFMFFSDLYNFAVILRFASIILPEFFICRHRLFYWTFKTKNLKVFKLYVPFSYPSYFEISAAFNSSILILLLLIARFYALANTSFNYSNCSSFRHNWI